MKIKLTFWRVVFLVIMALGVYSTYVRYLRGLGAVSNMTDQFPWGFWIGFDCLCGVMLAAGGFCIVGAVYLFNVESLHSVVRPAVAPSRNPRPRMSPKAQMRSPTRWKPNIE